MHKFNKEETKKEMYSFLESKGFPNITVQQIFDALPDMYRLLESKNMLTDGMNFATFKQTAFKEYREAEKYDKIRKVFSGFNFKL